MQPHALQRVRIFRGLALNLALSQSIWARRFGAGILTYLYPAYQLESVNPIVAELDPLEEIGVSSHTVAFADRSIFFVYKNKNRSV